MTKIKKLAEHMFDELDGAKDYAEHYVEKKAKGDSSWANRYKEMTQDELKHAMYIHELLVTEIDIISKVYTPSVECKESWDKYNKCYVEQASLVKQMLTL